MRIDKSVYDKKFTEVVYIVIMSRTAITYAYISHNFHIICELPHAVQSRQRVLTADAVEETALLASIARLLTRYNILAKGNALIDIDKGYIGVEK